MSANIVRGQPLCHFPFSLGQQKYKGYGCQDGKVFSVNSLCSSDSGTWTRPGGHGGKGSFSCRWLSGYSSRKRAGSFPRWLYLTSPSQSSKQCHLWAEPGRGEGLSLLSTPRFPHSVS